LIKTIKIKKKGGGTRLQKVKVLASGKYRFVKNTVKGAVRKTRAKGRPAYTKAKPTRKRVVRKSNANKPKKSSNRVAKKSLKSKIFGGTLGKVALGVGAGAIAGYAANMVAPQFSQFARPVAAYIAAGPIGLIADLALNQGLLSQITGMFGFGGNGGMVAQQEAGGL